MANIADQPTLVPNNDAFLLELEEKNRLWKRIALGAIVLLSTYMHFFQLGQNGFGNLYYASGVRSMADSWHNFFFVSLDPGGFVSVDKPALGFWLQTLSVKLFGFTPFSVFLPQALCGVFAVLLLYYLVQRHFGAVAGLVAALALAVSPISVATDRNNTIDGTLALILLLSVWAVIRASETGKLRWLLLGSVFVGLGFNTKMSEAYLIVPALGMAYLLCAPRKLWTRIWHLLIALLVMLIISLSWAVAVDTTPTAQRPYVGSTKDNSEISLAIGYNGLGRLHITSPDAPAQTNITNSSPSQNNAPPQNVLSPFRLFNALYGSQIGWLLPFALLAILALAWSRRFNRLQPQQHLGLVIWGFWLLTMTVFFTLDNSFHQYYLTVMAPGLCALVGIGLVVMCRQYSTPGWRGWLLPLALAITAGAQLSILAYYPDWLQHLHLFIIIPLTLMVLALLLLRLIQRPKSAEDAFRSLPYQAFRESAVRPLSSYQQDSADSMARTSSILAGIGMFTLLLAPLVWSCYTVAHNPESGAPIAGPTAQSNFSNFLFDHIRFSSKFISTNEKALISYLEKQQGHTKFLVATPSSGTADPLILATNRPVMSMGGFNNDPILTISSLQALIKNGTIRYFLVKALQPHNLAATFAPTATGQNSLTRWINSYCQVVLPQSWRQKKNPIGGYHLYDCASLRA